ncbi:putative nuclear RNA export factor SDE5 [Durio zibethinus]|uniref:Nuclear RNA export factor SDE5 n=1 Tax=Durio zibethinus TaxID=66656 RepID=A0A6P5WJF1_DURZI|nr:putative nuclear RNA export factor SDE5 [Durio zibethinus]
MEVSGLNGLQCDEEKALNSLLDAFGSAFSLKDIASAYCEAGQNADLAGEILYEMQGSTSSVAADASNDEVKNDETLESSCGNNSQNYCQANGDLRAPKQKVRPVSGGTVSSMLGKGYMKSVPLANGSYPGTKPLKVDSQEVPMSGLWGEGLKSSSLKEDHLHKDMEDFLFKMLGEGFRLDRDVIRQVLDSCGYDMQKSMEKLLDQSAVSLDKESKFLGESSKKTNDMHPRAEGPSQEKNRVLSANGGGRQQRDRNDIQKEVLTALFNGPERFDEFSRRRMRSAKRPIALGELVEGPPIDYTAEQKVDRVHSQEDKKDDEGEEDSFQVLRRAVKEYRGIMKEYYKAAVDAFAKGDQDLANRLLEEGQFFREKGRKADEESNQKIFETRNSEAEEEMLLDLHDHGAKEAIHLLKCHLSSLAGIPSFKYLKVIVETNEEDSSKGSRRRLVIKLLEKESIDWSEGETSGVVLIRLDNINPKRLSFAKK